MLSSTDISVDQLTAKLRKAITCAMRLLGSPGLVTRLDGDVELMSEGKSFLVEKDIYGMAESVLEYVLNTQLNPMGYQKPYSPEAMALAYVTMADALQRGLADHRLKIFFLKSNNNGSGWWRCDEPARMLMEKYPSLVWTECSMNIDYTELLPFDIIVVQNGIFGVNTLQIMAILNRLKQQGKKIVLTIDDDLQAMMQDNQAFYEISPLEWDAVKWLEQYSDAIICSTDKLARRISQPNKTIVLENALDLSRLAYPTRAPEREDSLLIVWHGGDTHERTLDQLGGRLKFLIEATPNLEKKIKKKIYWAFMGYFPEQLKPIFEFRTKGQSVTIHRGMDADLGIELEDIVLKGRQNIRYIQGIPIRQFHRFLINLNPDICLCPLSNTTFNLSKSDIKVQESTVAGAACVVSDIGPFASLPDGVVVKARQPEDFVRSVKELILDENRRRLMAETAMVWMRDSRNLRTTIDSWLEAFLWLIGIDLSTLQARTEDENSGLFIHAENK